MMLRTKGQAINELANIKENERLILASCPIV
jgi:hypothetical protein